MLKPRCTAESAHLAEIFSAIQGEGPRVGERQIFVRFLECHIRCPYCDTPDQDPRKVRPRSERTAGLRDWQLEDNPLGREAILERILRLQRHDGLHHQVSLTGGEPLWYWPMIEALAPALAERRLGLYLETDGLLTDELARVIEHVETIAMDVKLDWTRHGFLDREATLAFLALARSRPVELFCKIVIPANVEREPFLEVVAAVAEACQSEVRSGAAPVPLILQPVTPYGPVKEGPGPAEMLALHEAASALHPACRVVPQVHKLIGQH